MSTVRYRLHEGDLTDEAVRVAGNRGLIACDIETTGLDFTTDKIALVQVYAPGEDVEVVRINGTMPKRLHDLLADPSVRKIFHHAMFDMRFLRAQWGLNANNVACTKVAAKVLDVRTGPEHSLGPLLLRYLGVEIDKQLQTSDWLASRLTDAQLLYAVNDVVHLPRLLDVLSDSLQDAGRMWIAEGCWRHLPVRAELEVCGYPDVFQY